MTTDSPCADRPRLNDHYRLQWEPAQEAFVLLYPEGMVRLNQSAAAILQRCDGSRTVPELIADLEQAFSKTPLEREVCDFVEFAARNGWLKKP
jgi:pyrroloquinoline quinone biosynthesis protein D